MVMITPHTRLYGGDFEQNGPIKKGVRGECTCHVAHCLQL